MVRGQRTCCVLALAVAGVPFGFSRALGTTILDGTTLDYALVDDAVVVRNGLMLVNGASILTTGAGTGADLRFYGTQTISGNGTIYLNNERLEIYKVTSQSSPPAVLTIESGVTITTPALPGAPGGVIETWFSNGATLVNHGMIWANGAGIGLEYFPWTNHGTLRASSGGTVFLGGSLTNAPTGVIEAIDGGTIAVKDDFSGWPWPIVTNQGLLRVRNGTLRLIGSLKWEDFGNHEFYNATLYGGRDWGFTLDNHGRVLEVNATTGPLTLAGNANVAGGTIRTRDGADLILTPEPTAGTATSHYFENVTVDGVVRSSATTDRLYVSGDLHVTAGSKVQVDGTVQFNESSGSILGQGEVTVGSIIGNNVTFGPGITIKSSPVPGMLVNATVTNLGTMQLDTGAYNFNGNWTNVGTIRINGGGGSFNGRNGSFTNSGEITVDGPEASFGFSSAGTNTGSVRVSNGGRLTIYSSQLVNTGSIEIGPGSSVSLRAFPAVLGNVTVNSGTVNVVTPVTLAQLGGIAATRSTFVVMNEGAVDLGGGTLTASEDIAWRVFNGTFSNGTIATTIASDPGAIFNELDGITLSGGAGFSGGSFEVIKSLTLASGAAVRLGTAAGLQFAGTQSLTGSGAIVFDAAGNFVRPSGAAGGTLTIGAGVTVRTGAGSGTVGAQALGLVNQGTISARTPGESITVTGLNWTNAGLLEATNGASLSFAGTFSTAGMGSITTAGGGHVVIAGALNNAAATLTLSDSMRVLLSHNGTVTGGTVASADQTPLTVMGRPANASGTATLSGVQLTAPVILLPGAVLAVQGGSVEGPVVGTSATMTMGGAWTNAGSIALGGGSRLTLSGTLPASLGAIALTDSTLILATPATTSKVAQVTRQNSGLQVSSALDNTGATLSGSTALEGLTLAGGSITGGTVAMTDAAQLLVSGGANTLNGVAVEGNVTLQSGALTIGPSGVTPVDMRLRLVPATSSASVTFSGSQTLGGTVEAIFDGTLPASTIRPGSGGTLTLGAGVTVRTGTQGGTVGASDGALVVNGLVSAQTAGRTVFLRGTSITNNGTLEVQNSGTLRVVGPFSQPQGQIDVVSGVVLLDYASAGPSPIDFVRGEARAGRLGTSADDANPAHPLTIAYVESAQAGARLISLAGQTVDLTTLIVRVTVAGDADVDGVISGNDYAMLDRSAAKGLANAYWVDGDFDYDGVITAGDYLLIDASMARQGGGTLSAAMLAEREARFGSAYVEGLMAAVPEPAGGALLVGCGSLLVGGRRGRARGG